MILLFGNVIALFLLLLFVVVLLHYFYYTYLLPKLMLEFLWKIIHPVFYPWFASWHQVVTCEQASLTLPRLEVTACHVLTVFWLSTCSTEDYD